MSTEKTRFVVTAHSLGEVDFEGARAVWRRSTDESKQAARLLAEMALLNFYEHGSTNLCQAFLEDLEGQSGKNYVRVAAYKIWLRDHSPITMNGNKLVKKPNADFDPALIAKALGTPFWDHAPDKEQVLFESTDVIKALNQTLAKFEKKMPKNEDAIKQVNEARKAIGSIALIRTVTPKSNAA